MAEPQRWYPDTGRRTLPRVMTLLGVVFLGLAISRVVGDVHDTRGDAFFTGVLFLQAVLFTAQGWGWPRIYVEADDEGVTVSTGWRPRTVPWADIAELRPTLPYSWATLVIVRHDGERVDLPLPADHRGLLDRWEAVTSQREQPPT